MYLILSRLFMICSRLVCLLLCSYQNLWLPIIAQNIILASQKLSQTGRKDHLKNVLQLSHLQVGSSIVEIRMHKNYSDVRPYCIE